MPEDEYLDDRIDRWRQVAGNPNVKFTEFVKYTAQAVRYEMALRRFERTQALLRRLDDYFEATIEAVNARSQSPIS